MIASVPDYLLVDGYNMIHHWPELSALKQSSLEHARYRLLTLLAGYTAYTALHTIVVFDAHAVKDRVSRHENIDGIDVVFTKEGETADSVIEKLAHSLCCSGKGRVYVATSDRAEQLVVMGSGAYRISARELLEDVRQCSAQLEQEYGPDILRPKRWALEGRIRNNMRLRLECWRKGQD